jgi:FkbM family methyltransferase
MDSETTIDRPWSRLRAVFRAACRRAGLREPSGDRPWSTQTAPALILADTDNGPMLVRQDDTVIGRALRQDGHFEEAVLCDVVRFLVAGYGFRPTLFVDVGANIGTHLLRALKEGLFPRGVGIEMDADNFRLLTANVALNGHQGRARLLHVALSDTRGPGLMEVAVDNKGDHRVRTADGSDRAPAEAYGESRRITRPVAVETLDGIEATGGTRFADGALVWVDVQGHEGHVLAGAERILGREPRPAFVIEFWPYGVERAGGRTRLFRFLEACNAIHDIRAAGWETAPPVDVTALADRYDRALVVQGGERLSHTDLLCLP